jgi:hypothetical protein
MCGVYGFEDERQAICAPSLATEQNLLSTKVKERAFLLMCRISLVTFLSATVLALISNAQAPDPKEEQERQILALVKEVQTQQAQIVANQASITAKLGDLAETMRVARIFSRRSH